MPAANRHSPRSRGHDRTWLRCRGVEVCWTGVEFGREKRGGRGASGHPSPARGGALGGNGPGEIAGTQIGGAVEALEGRQIVCVALKLVGMGATRPASV